MPAVLMVFAAIAVLLPVGAGAVDGVGDKIYWGNEGAGMIRVANLDGTGAPSTVIGGEGGPCGVAIDPAAGKIYWATFNSGQIRVANLDGTGAASNLFGDDGSLCGVAIDPAAGKIYWANFSSSTIRVANLDGTGTASVLFAEQGGSGPSGLAIDPAAGKIYWTNQLLDEVRVANLDGSGTASTLFGPADAADNPIGVAIDPAAGKIYWAALLSGQIRIGNLDGTGSPATLFGVESGPGAVAIDPGAGKIYWATFFSGSIRSGNLDGSGTPATLFDFESTPLFPALLRAPEVGAELPSISGGASLGDALTCSTGSWASNLLGAFLFRAPRSFSYQWQLGGTDIPGATASTYSFTEAGDYTCRVTASNHAGSASQTSAAVSVTILGVEAFYDSNANGQFDTGESAITGWRVRVGSDIYVTPRRLRVDPGVYQVSEADPVQTNWRHTNASSVLASLDAGDGATVEFGNVCLGGGGGLGSGFWGNKHGQQLFGAEDLALMVSLNLRTADGSHFNPTSYSVFKNWLGKSAATNMAYDLSSQLATMRLNVLNEKVSGDSRIHAPGSTSASAAGFTTVNAVMVEANDELGLHGVVKSGSSFRVYQTALRDALLKANGNSTFVQATLCSFGFS